LYAETSLVVAPSTGPLHLAVAAGKPVVTFYPPIKVQSALRWGPYVADESRASVLVPEVYCGEDFTCRGSLCNYYPCMKSLTVAQALEQANFQLSRHGVGEEGKNGENPRS
jgi:heptosyltransferase-3